MDTSKFNEIFESRNNGGRMGNPASGEWKEIATEQGWSREEAIKYYTYARTRVYTDSGEIASHEEGMEAIQ